MQSRPTQGVLVANADFIGGFALWVDEEGMLIHTYSLLGVETYKHVATERVPTGDVTLRMLFEADEPKPGTGGTVMLWANDRQIGAVADPAPVRHAPEQAHQRAVGISRGDDNVGAVDIGLHPLGIAQRPGWTQRRLADTGGIFFSGQAGFLCADDHSNTRRKIVSTCLR